MQNLREFQNTARLSISSLAQIIYEFYNPSQSQQQEEVTDEQNTTNNINPINVNNDTTTNRKQSQKEGGTLEKLPKHNSKNRKTHESSKQTTPGLTAESIINIIDQRLANYIASQKTTASSPYLIGNPTNQPAPTDKNIFSATTTTLQNPLE